MAISKAGLVLSGGGAKGAYQVGVLRYMAESGMAIDAIAGASIGALNGAVIAGANNINEASENLQQLWQALAQESPLKFNASFATSFLGYLSIMGTTHLSPMMTFVNDILKQQKIADIRILDDSPVIKLINTYTSPEKLKGGLPLYVSVFESNDNLTTAVTTALGILGIVDTPPSEFRHVQAFPDDKQRDVILASASLPLLFSPQEIDGKRYVDGGIGGWQKAQGNTPITPLISLENCTHVIVTHLGDGSLWNRYDFPNTTILEVRPKKPITQESMLKDLLNFKTNKINRWIEQGYEDAGRCIGNVAQVLKEQSESKLVTEKRNAALQALDNDLFSLTSFIKESK